MPYCMKCGAEFQTGAAFCSKCGASTTAAPQPPTAPQPPSYQYRYGEKQEKREKQEKQTRQGEKSEKHEKSGDRSGPLVGGAILILLGVILYLTITIPTGQTTPYIQPADFWAWFLFGIGVILILQALYRYAALPHKASAIGPLIGGTILLAIGGAGIISIQEFWPLVFIAIGVIIIIIGVTARSRAPRP